MEGREEGVGVDSLCRLEDESRLAFLPGSSSEAVVQTLEDCEVVGDCTAVSVGEHMSKLIRGPEGDELLLVKDMFGQKDAT